MAQNNYQKVNMVAGPMRLSYAFIFKPYQPKEAGAAPYYSADLLIPKENEDVWKSIKEAINSAIPQDAIRNGKLPDKFNLPFKDGDEKDNEAYNGCYYIRTKSKSSPAVYKKVHGEMIKATEDDIYSGCWVFAQITFQAYNHTGSRGVTCYLNQLLKYKDDDVLGGVSYSPDAFNGVQIPNDTTTLEVPDDKDDTFPF